MEEADFFSLGFFTLQTNTPYVYVALMSHLHCSGRGSWWLFWLTFSKGTSVETLPLTKNTILTQRTLQDVDLTERRLVHWRNVLEADGGTPMSFSLSLCFLDAMRYAALLCVSPLCGAQRRHRPKGKRTYWQWTQTPETRSQDKDFFLEVAYGRHIATMWNSNTPWKTNKLSGVNFQSLP